MALWSLPQSRRPELMDDPALGEADHFHALRALARINTVSRTAAQIAAAVTRMAWQTPRTGTDRPLLVVDVGCGGGDVSVAIATRLARDARLRPVRLLGIDISPRAVDYARTRTAAAAGNVSFSVHDAVASGCPPCDFAVSSLFLHHLDDTTATALVRSMAAASAQGIVVSDLVRSPIGLALAVAGTRLLSGSRVARIDGPLSVRAARTPAEYRRLLDAAGLGNATIGRIWPERVLATWRKPLAEVRRATAEASHARSP